MKENNMICSVEFTLGEKKTLLYYNRNMNKWRADGPNTPLKST